MGIRDNGMQQDFVLSDIGMLRVLVESQSAMSGHY
jgi:hypothetical protein